MRYKAGLMKGEKMTENDKIRFAELIFGLAETLGSEIGKPGIALYFRALQQYSIEEIEKATDKILTTSRFFPKPVEFIEAIEGKSDERAEVAFSQFAEAVRLGGYMKSVYSADACLIQAVKQVFGSWQRACEELPPVSDPMFANMRKSFLMAYQSALRNGSKEHYLIGRSESINIGNEGLASFKLTGVETFQARLVTITDKVRLIEAEFSASTGRLCDAGILSLPGMQPEINQLSEAIQGLLVARSM
jgi:hypothetical protein